MPTQKPRFTVTVNRPVYETIARMAKLTKQSKSRLIAEMLDTIHPPLMRTVALLEAASEAPLQVREGLKQSVESLEVSIRASAEANTAQMDWLLTALSPPADSGSGGGEGSRKGSRRHPNPRTSNTGVRSPKRGNVVK